MQESVSPHCSVGLARACREMLRLGHPDHLRHNVLVAQIAAAAAVDVGRCSDDDLTRLVRSAIEAVVEALPPRQQTIVRRSEIGGERIGLVAASLAISKRHAFRARDAAIASIVERLTAHQPPKPVAQSVVSVGDTYVMHARTLEQNGHYEAAAAVLGDIAASTADFDRRCWIETRLVRLAIDYERYTQAERHLAAARTFLVQDAATPAWRIAEVDAAAARLASATGAMEEADRLARRSAIRLRAGLAESAQPRIRNALIDVLELRAWIASGHGQLGASLELANEGRELAAQSGVDPHVAIVARTAAANARLLVAPGNPTDVEAELVACYRAAIEFGFTREALYSAAHLAGLYAATQRPELTVKLLTPLVPSARLVGHRECAAGLLYELAKGHYDLGCQASAKAFAAEMSGYAQGHVTMEPWAQFLMARITLALRDDAAALHLAQNAEAGFSRTGKERVAGSTLAIQAQCLARLGQGRQAIELARRSVEALAGRSHPVPLASAYVVLGTVSGDRRHASTARRLLRSV
jgi:hypothetical protein